MHALRPARATSPATRGRRALLYRAENGVLVSSSLRQLASDNDVSGWTSDDDAFDLRLGYEGPRWSGFRIGEGDLQGLSAGAFLAFSKPDLSLDLEGAPLEHLLQNRGQVDALEAAGHLEGQVLDEFAARALALLGGEVGPLLRHRVAERLAHSGLAEKEARQAHRQHPSEDIRNPAEPGFLVGDALDGLSALRDGGSGFFPLLRCHGVDWPPMGESRVREIMQRKIVTISAGDTLSTVEDIMTLGHVRHMPVVTAGKLVGVVSERDLLRASLSTLNEFGTAQRRAFLYAVEIARVMSAPPIVIEADQTVEEAAKVMAEHKIGCLPVVDLDELVGMLTETDVLRYFAGMPPDLG